MTYVQRLLLRAIKARHAGDWAEWERLLERIALVERYGGGK